MACFSALPNELVSEVAGHVMPEDIEFFPLISKGVYGVALPLLEEHRVLKIRYSKFQNIKKADFNGRRFESSRYFVESCMAIPDVSSLLTAILTSHRVALYIKELCIGGMFEGWKPSYEHIPYTEGQFTLFKQALSKYVLPSKLETWIEELESGNANPIISLLLILLPDLISIKSDQFIHRTIQLGGVIERINTDCIPKNAILSHLEQIDFMSCHNWNGWNTRPIDCLASLATIPSIKSLYGQWISTCLGTHDFSGLLPQSSNITDVGFKKCSISLRQLDDLFQGLKALQIFQYIDGMRPWDPAGICKLLSKHAQRSLEVLDLRSEHILVAPIENLGDFRVLKELSLSFSLFQVGGLASQLPFSLQKFILHDITGSHISVRDLKDTIREVVRFKPRRFPRLEKICLHGTWCSGSHVQPTDKLRKLCENAGFELCFMKRNLLWERDDFDWEDEESSGEEAKATNKEEISDSEEEASGREEEE